ncbi:YkgB family protein [Pseudonocardia xinjiangensis]|uniref:YkgB family protein n=1 Tax=Pseudonocardia xinjiangensis TaxID=75289 RepID=UPI003D8BC7B2
MTVIGSTILRYGLALVIAWIGALKFASYEATAIMPLIANSPYQSWLYDIFGVQTLAAVIGTVEIVAAVLIALRPWLPRASAVGSAVAVVLFLSILSYLFTTPGIGGAGGGFPALSMTDQFLIKDLVLLGASVWTLGESLAARRRTVR